MCVLLFDTFNGCSSSIKEINRLLWTGMSNIYYWKADVLKTSIFSERKFEKVQGTKYLQAKRYKVHSGGKFILALLSSAVFHPQNRVSDVL